MEYPSTDIFYMIDKNGNRTVRKVRDDFDWKKEYPNKPKPEPYSCSYHNPPIAEVLRNIAKKTVLGDM
jgi:hypothetical protein